MIAVDYLTSATSPVPAVLCLLVAIVTGHFLVRWFGAPESKGRVSSIDGLRGYLAYFVYLHHVCIWYFYLRTGNWESPPSHLYAQFGHTSVVLFFMITGFLFYSKLISGRTKRIDWLHVYVSRVFRLVPLYVFAMCLLFAVVAVLSHGVRNESVPRLAIGALRWIGFTTLGSPDLNGVEHTSRIIAGVTWSLRYEWIFYFALPVLALTAGVIPPMRYLALGCLSLIVVGYGLYTARVDSVYLTPFVGGLAAAVLARVPLVRQISTTKTASFVVLGCIAATVIAYPSAYGPVPLFLLSVSFILIACGNDLFGALASPVSHIIGEMAYSIYLLHGILLFSVMTFVIGHSTAHDLSPMAYWSVAGCLTPILLMICYGTYRMIELPPMRGTARFLTFVRYERRAERLTELGRHASHANE